ncbi:hypothetical protein D3C76_1360620 [compost metagenome]
MDALHGTNEQAQLALCAAQRERQRRHTQVSLEQVDHQLPFPLEPDGPIQHQGAPVGVGGQVADNLALLALQQQQCRAMAGDHFIVRCHHIEPFTGVPAFADVGPLHHPDAVHAQPGEALVAQRT